MLRIDSINFFFLPFIFIVKQFSFVLKKSSV